MNRSLASNRCRLWGFASRQTRENLSDSFWCETCREPLAEDTQFTAPWDKRGRRVSLCQDCLGELFFDILPRVTDATPDTPAGRGSPLGDSDPWQENAIRVLEGTND